jgi:hypothetical protein
VDDIAFEGNALAFKLGHESQFETGAEIRHHAGTAGQRRAAERYAILTRRSFSFLTGDTIRPDCSVRDITGSNIKT